VAVVKTFNFKQQKAPVKPGVFCFVEGGIEI
jgi:hypothetical protein